jgi:hypothetical protein
MHNVGKHLTVLAALAFGFPVLTQAAIISSGTVTIPGTFTFDFDAGVVPPTAETAADVFWEIFTSTTRGLQPDNGTSLVNLGVVNFNTITLAQLEALSYGTSFIDGGNATNLLVPGDVFAVHTNLGNFAKAVVTGPLDPQFGPGLPIQWETDSAAVPEPQQFPLAAVAIAAGLIAIWRRRVTG